MHTDSATIRQIEFELEKAARGPGGCLLLRLAPN